jgi:hypothetical protein
MKRYQKIVGTVLVAAIVLLAIDYLLYIQDRKWMNTQTEIILSKQNADGVRQYLIQARDQKIIGQFTEHSVTNGDIGGSQHWFVFPRQNRAILFPLLSEGSDSILMNNVIAFMDAQDKPESVMTLK